MPVEFREDVNPDVQIHILVDDAEGNRLRFSVLRSKELSLEVMLALGNIVMIETARNELWTAQQQTAALAEGTPTVLTMHDADRSKI